MTVQCAFVFVGVAELLLPLLLYPKCCAFISDDSIFVILPIMCNEFISSSIFSIIYAFVLAFEINALDFMA